MVVQEAIYSISKHLSRLSEQIKILNRIGDFSINIYAENALMDFLSVVFDANFSNTNAAEKNKASIDLLDSNKRIAIQITSTPDIKKIKDCVGKFVSNKVYKNADHLYIYILTERNKTYNDAELKDQLAKVDISFDASNIIDKADVVNRLYHTNDTERIVKARYVLTRQFVKIAVEENLSTYYSELRSKYVDVVLNDDRGMVLKDIYVCPFFSVWASSIRNPELDIDSTGFADHERFNNIHEFVNDHFLGKAPQEHVKISNVLLVLGYPGQGKTSFCKKLLYSYICEGMQEKKIIFYFRLKDLRHGKSLIDSPVNTLYNEAILQTETDLDKFSFRKSILVLDGLDELYMKEDLKLDDIERFCKELLRETEKHKKLQVIITSRYGYIDLAKFRNEALTVIRIGKFSMNLQMEWIQKYLRYHPDCKLTESKITEYHKSKNHKYIAELLEQPLLLHMIASLKSDVVEHADRTAIYDQLFNELIQRKYSEEGQIENLRNISQSELRELIQEIAFSIYLTGNGYISRDQLLKLESVKKYLANFFNQDFRESIKGIMISFYFQESVNKNDDKDFVLEFLHKSLEEYMVAEKMLRTVVDGFLNLDRKGRYLIDSPQKSLALFHELFSAKPMTEEVEEYLVSLISKMSTGDVEDLHARVVLFFDEMMAKNFLYEYSCHGRDEPILTALCVFKAVWILLTRLKPDYNYLENSRTQGMFTTLVNIVENNFAGTLRSVDVSYQDLSGSTLESFWGIGYGSSMVKTSFSGSDIFKTNFLGITIDSVDFEDTTLEDVKFEDCNLLNCSFDEADFSGVQFFACDIDNCSFVGSYLRSFTFDGCKFINMTQEHFYNICITLEVLRRLLGHNLDIDLKAIKKIAIDNDAEYISMPAAKIRALLKQQ